MDDEYFDDSGDDYDTWEGRRRDALQEVSDALGVQFHRGGISWALPEDENSEFKGLRTGVKAYAVGAVSGKGHDESPDHRLMFETHSESGHRHSVDISRRNDQPGLRVDVFTDVRSPWKDDEDDEDGAEGPLAFERFRMRTGRPGRALNIPNSRPDEPTVTTSRHITDISELGNVLREHDQSIPPPSSAARAYNEAYEEKYLGVDSRRARAAEAGTEVDPMMLPKIRKYTPRVSTPEDLLFLGDFDLRLDNHERVLQNRVDPKTGRVVTPGNWKGERITNTPYDFMGPGDSIDLPHAEEIHNEILGRSAQFHAASNDWQFKRMMKAEKALEDQKTDPRNPWGRL